MDKGVITVPKSWKIYDEQWNNNITHQAGYTNSKKRTILRASDYSNSTFYVKLSFKVLDEAISAIEINSSDFLEILNNDLKSIKQQIAKDPQLTFITSKSAINEKHGTGMGGAISYTYKDKEGQTRKSIIYTIIKGKIFYNLTVSWDVNKNSECEKILNKLKSSIIYSE